MNRIVLISVNYLGLVYIKLYYLVQIYVFIYYYFKIFVLSELLLTTASGGYTASRRTLTEKAKYTMDLKKKKKKW